MNVQEAKETFRGPMISVATPFTEAFELDLDALHTNIRRMVDRGVRRGQGVLLVAAAGGEFPMMTMEERKEVTRASVEAANGDVAIATSIQFNSSRDVVELARYAQEAGAELGQLSAPFYYEPPDDDIYDHFKAAAQGSDLPLMIYNNWWNTLSMNAKTVDRLTGLDNIVALKWSSPDMRSYTEGLRMFTDRLAVIDNHGQHVWSHMMGAVGFITHVSNFWPEYPLQIWDILCRKDYEEIIPALARFKWEWAKWVSKVVAETEGEGPFIKAAMEEVGITVGPPRQPARRPSPGLLEELHQLFVEVGIPREG